ncbi:hypothetical protein K7432_004428 [Basidiobolus ranarum]|uniref:RNA helicase n=1 Tax=Basidiobolus ranarum TaxID=34480 RepID=A0ABR2W4W2_9FUNG
MENEYENGPTEEDEYIKEKKIEQRWAEPGEPICIICGRYGEYVCDQTEHDVCSIECKLDDIENFKTSNCVKIPLDKIPPPPTLPVLSSANIETGLLHASLTAYTGHSDVETLSETQVNNIRRELDIRVKGRNLPKPIIHFSQAGLASKLQYNLERYGYTSPTPIQMQSIPCILEGRDVLGSAPTGSGKTGAYLIPTIAHAYSLSKYYQGARGPYAIILNPTRELCIQIEEQTKQLIEGLENMKTALIVGGLPMPSQIHRLKQGVQLVIATPGRLLEIISTHEELFENIKILVMDEVDSMFKMGFEYQVKQILEMITQQPKQTLMFSATIPSNIERITKTSLNSNSVQINVGKPRMPNESVKQTFMWVENASKKKQLFSILNDPKYFRPPVIIFVDSKIGADLLAQAIYKKCNLNTVAIHSDKTQEERTSNLKGFLQGEYPVLVSTGVLGRGVDLVDVTQVINFDMATTVDEYIHQIGRAGRLGVPGWSITFINEDHKHLFRELLEVLKPLPSKQLTPLPPQLLNSRYSQGIDSRDSKHRKKRRFQ